MKCSRRVGEVCSPPRTHAAVRKKKDIAFVARFVTTYNNKRSSSATNNNKTTRVSYWHILSLVGNAIQRRAVGLELRTSGASVKKHTQHTIIFTRTSVSPKPSQ